jgi:hypothetical protein
VARIDWLAITVSLVAIAAGGALILLGMWLDPVRTLRRR